MTDLPFPGLFDKPMTENNDFVCLAFKFRSLITKVAAVVHDERTSSTESILIQNINEIF